MITKIDALLKLKPNAEWVWRGDNYDGLEWLDQNQTKPTEQEILDKQAELQVQEEQDKINKEARIASAKAKLEALGLTTEEIKDTFGL